MSRSLRSKRLRAMLYFLTDGKCAICGVRLEKGWHADHVVPWSKTKRTNVHEMQPLCPPCNLKKGAKRMELRKHQEQLEERAERIAEGGIESTRTVADVTPGGGKTIGAAVYSRVLLDAKKVEGVCIVCPRTTLKKQTALGFHHGKFNPEYQATDRENALPLFEKLPPGEPVQAAYTTTYQAIASAPDLHRQQFQARKMLLVLDEPHHLADDEGARWTKSIEPLEAAAVHTLLMSGTIERHDGRPIPFVEYEYDATAKKRFPKTDIRYTRSEAIADGAILPVVFELSQGPVEWVDKDGTTHKRNIEDEGPDEEVKGAIRTALDIKDFWGPVVDRAVERWRQDIEGFPQGNPPKLIVVCGSQSKAENEVLPHLEGLGVEALLAISDRPDAHKEIDRFRTERRPLCLVTVGMAHEGLDVPAAMHLVYLSPIRSHPHMDQVLGRIARADGPHKKKCWMYMLDDCHSAKWREHIYTEQRKGLEEREERIDLPEPGPNNPPEGRHISLDGEMSGTRYADRKTELTPEQSRMAEQWRQEYPGLGDEPTVFRFAEDLQRGRAGAGRGAASAQTEAKPSTKTVNDRRKELLKRINKLASEIDSKNAPEGEKPEHGAANKVLFKRCGYKHRQNMTLAELEDAYDKAKKLAAEYPFREFAAKGA